MRHRACRPGMSRDLSRTRGTRDDCTHYKAHRAVLLVNGVVLHASLHAFSAHSTQLCSENTRQVESHSKSQTMADDDRQRLAERGKRLLRQSRSKKKQSAAAVDTDASGSDNVSVGSASSDAEYLTPSPPPPPLPVHVQSRSDSLDGNRCMAGSEDGGP